MTRHWRPRGRTLALLGGLAAAALMGLAGCSTLGYYAQSAEGHLKLMHAARAVPEVIADPATPDLLRRRLERAQELRAFSIEALGLPDNGSYRRYADLQRPYVVWSVVAAPALSLELKQWCYPVVGCAGYRGYFDQAEADALAATLAAAGYDVQVAGIPAYSTLGWFDDPLLNTFVGSEHETARLLFHELAHQVVYLAGDTTFNESFATAVEREGIRRWLAHRADPAATRAYAESSRRREDFLALLLEARRRLAADYAAPGSADDKRQRKEKALAALRADYAALKQRWGGFAGYDRFFAQPLGNAHLAAVGVYNDRVPAFDVLLAQAGGDLPRFYAEVKRLAALAPAERNAALDALAPLPVAPPG